jgi:hypothetical protein
LASTFACTTLLRAKFAKNQRDFRMPARILARKFVSALTPLNETLADGAKNEPRNDAKKRKVIKDGFLGGARFFRKRI